MEGGFQDQTDRQGEASPGVTTPLAVLSNQTALFSKITSTVETHTDSWQLWHKFGKEPDLISQPKQLVLTLGEGAWVG